MVVQYLCVYTSDLDIQLTTARQIKQRHNCYNETIIHTHKQKTQPHKNHAQLQLQVTTL